METTVLDASMKTKTLPQSLPLEGTDYELLGARIELAPDPTNPGILAVCVLVSGVRKDDPQRKCVLTGCLATLGQSTAIQVGQAFANVERAIAEGKPKKKGKKRR